MRNECFGRAKRAADRPGFSWSPTAAVVGLFLLGLFFFAAPVGATRPVRRIVEPTATTTEPWLVVPTDDSDGRVCSSTECSPCNPDEKSMSHCAATGEKVTITCTKEASLRKPAAAALTLAPAAGRDEIAPQTQEDTIFVFNQPCRSKPKQSLAPYLIFLLVAFISSSASVTFIWFKRRRSGQTTVHDSSKGA